MIVPIEFAPFLSVSYHEPLVNPAGPIVAVSTNRVGILFGCFPDSDVAISPATTFTSGNGYVLNAFGQSTLRLGWLEHGPLVQLGWNAVVNAGAANMAVSEIMLPPEVARALMGEITLEEAKALLRR